MKTYRNRIVLMITVVLATIVSACGSTSSNTENASTLQSSVVIQEDQVATAPSVKEATTSDNSHLADGIYTTTLVSSPTEFSNTYIVSISFEDDQILIDAAFTQYDDNYKSTDFERALYIIPINKDTIFVSGGGNEDPIEMTRPEFESYIKELMESELGLSISITNGIATKIGIWS